MDQTADEIRLWERKAVMWLLGLLAAAFAAWAGVVWNATDKMISRFDVLVERMSAQELAQERQRLVDERRFTILEQQVALLQQRQQVVMNRLNNGKGMDIP